MDKQLLAQLLLLKASKTELLIAKDTDRKIKELSQDLVDKISNIEIKHGKDGKTPTKEEIIALIEPLIPEPIKGDDGESPSQEYLFDLIKSLIPEVKDGQDGKDYIITQSDLEEIAQLVNVEVPEIEEKTPEQVRDLLETLKGDERLDVSAIKGLNEKLKSISNGKVVSGSGKTWYIKDLKDVDLSNIPIERGKYVLGAGILLNRVIVREADDFGDSIDSNKEYFIDGAIDLGTKEIIVPTGGITIGGFGYDISLLYSSEDNHTIFKNADGSYSGNVTINNVNLYSTGSNSKIFDLDNDSNFGAVELNTVNLGRFSSNTASIGNISNYRQFRTSNFAAIRYVDGFTFSGSMSGIAINDSIILSPLAGSTFVNAGVGLNITDSFSSNMNALSLSGNMVWSDISNSNFSDDGLADFSKLRLGGDNPLPNITADDTRAFFRQCRGIDNTFISSSWEITAETPTSIAAANTPVKLAGTTTNVIGSWFQSGGDNRLTYIGLREVKVDINAVIALSSSNTETFRVIVRQWDDSEGVFIDLTKGRIETALKILGDRLGDRSFLSVATIDTNDYIEVWIENLANTNDPTGQIESVLIVTERQV